MRGKLILVAGLATGYVLGSRAGRKRYDQIATAAGKLWHNRSVQHQVHTVEDAARSQAPLALDLLTVVVKRMMGKSTTRRNAAAFANDPGRDSTGRRNTGAGRSGSRGSATARSGSATVGTSAPGGTGTGSTGSGDGSGAGSSGSNDTRSANDRSTSI